MDRFYSVAEHDANTGLGHSDAATALWDEVGDDWQPA